MDRDQVLTILRERAGDLQSAGVRHLRLFGSVARDEATVQSDVDLMAEFEPTKKLTLVTVGRLQADLADWLGTSVDLSSAGWMPETVRTKALAEAVLVF